MDLRRAAAYQAVRSEDDAGKDATIFIKAKGPHVVHKPQPVHFLLLAVAIASVSPSSIIARLAGEAPPLVISFYRLLFATLMLAPYAVYNARREHEHLTLKEIGILAGIGLMLAAHFAVWVTSLFYTSVASSAVLVTTEALWVPLGAAFLLRERLGPRIWVGVAIAFGGSVLLVSGDARGFAGGSNPVLGDLLALAGAIAASIYFLAGRRYRQRISLPTYATIVYGWSTLFLFLFVLIRGDAFGGYQTKTYAWMFVFALVPMILGHTIINYILRWIQPHVISTSVLMEPVISGILAFVLFDERLSVLVYVGGVLILGGIGLATSKPAPEPGKQEEAQGDRTEGAGGQEGPAVVQHPEPPR